jgi:hypothetical protein
MSFGTRGFESHPRRYIRGFTPYLYNSVDTFPLCIGQMQDQRSQITKLQHQSTLPSLPQELERKIDEVIRQLKTEPREN